MKPYDYLAGLLADVISSLGLIVVSVAVAFIVALLAGWLDAGEVLAWLRSF